LVFRFTAVTEFPPPGPPEPLPPVGWALLAPEDEDDEGDADEDELVVPELQPATVSTVAASRPAVRDIFLFIVGRTP
jgi:hypothetical protein